MLTIALIISFFFAMNIGASGTAASMGAAYGGGAVNKKWIALLLAAISVFLGAWLGGGEVVKTLSGGIIPSELLNVELTIAIIASACLTLFVANMMGVPLSTSEVTIGAIIGVGVAYQQLFIGKIIFILAVWMVLPFVAYFIAYGVGKLIAPLERKIQGKRSKLYTRLLTVLLLIAGCYEAFSAGMNNVANAIGPLVGADLISSASAILWGGLFVSLGALLLGGKALETNAKKITKLTLMKSTAVSLTSGTLVVVASLFGLPVPLTQATTMAILGIGTVNDGRAIWKSDVVRKVIKVWIFSPLSSLLVSYAIVATVIQEHFIGIVILALAVLVIAGYRMLGKALLVRRKRAFQK
ncbi:inorganic phosphate transporter [Paenibacillus sp. HB172176]|uniref:inorganic phosphate transporter n=1 Tax=Paenibacillus sp. HB172176 TaxID=2493690 RepID=UPI00143C5D12|nr:inorganic phosphate transporter [Paenibacillus sp. HB172176]